MPSGRPLFEIDLPDGFHYRPDFIGADEESALGHALERVEFSIFEMRGVPARRRVAFFGRSYDAGGPSSSPPIPAFLVPLRDRAAAWAGVDPAMFAMALVNEYPPGAPIGWHRDAPQYGMVAGVSLLAPCRMKFRPVQPRHGQAEVPVMRRVATHEITLAPRSGYLMAGNSRSAYEHHIPAVDALRYSITFRTLKS